MALADAYASVQSYRNLINKPDLDDNEAIESDLLAVSRYLDRKLHQFFTKDDTVQVRYFQTAYRGLMNAEAENPWRGLRGDAVLYIDPIATATGLVVVIDENRDGLFTSETPMVLDTDFHLYPRNALTGPEPRPYSALYLTSFGGYRVWPPATQVKITATWGWPAIPKAIERATIHLTGILRLETPRATRRVQEFDTTVEQSGEARSILEGLQKAYRRQPSV